MTLDARVRGLETLEANADNVHAWATAVSMALNFPGIVEFWQFGNYDKSTGEVHGLAQRRNLTRVNGVNFGYSGLIPFADFNGTNHYFSRADETQLDMTAATATQGVMTFGWFNVRRLATAEMLICKRSGATSNYNYYLVKLADNRIQSNVFNGAAQTAAASAAITTGWHFLGMIWNSAKLSVFVDGVETQNTTSVPTVSNNSTAAFTVGAGDGGAAPFDGLASCVFLGQRTAQTFMTTFYELTRPLYQ